MDDGFPFTTVLMVLDGAGVLHRPFLRSFRGVGIFSVARHVSAQQLRLWLFLEAQWQTRQIVQC